MLKFLFKKFTVKEDWVFDDGSVLPNSKRTSIFGLFARLFVNCFVTGLAAYYMYNIHIGNLVWK
jgi:hypothetical protein